MIILLRLNQTSVFIQREGVFYGQCSELCGLLLPQKFNIENCLNIDNK